ncbi:radical SAM/SPASM domain-containing protein [Frankia sp. B2]|uniref:radical SAM protein n=1 Tax=Frankia sp. B2 TaxID=2541730 RepID=UPI00106B5F27|nr:radical SAM protein [Frankia sp. B2]TFE31012.1 radical SAM/SPASM domain-containing protein [Frankia sp. B2]
MSTPTAPEIVYFGLFDNCNARCTMCDCWQLPRSAQSFTHYVQILDRVLTWRPRAVRFTGGEPLLFPRLPELVTRASAAGCRVSVISNGRILAPRVPALAEHGCDEVVISIDGLAARHDLIRGTPGLFARCMLSLDALHRARLPYGVNTVIQASGLADLRALGTVLRERPNPPAWWHLIPVRGNPVLAPDDAQCRTLHSDLDHLRQSMAEARCDVVVDDAPFAAPRLVPCVVPEFTAYVRADSGDVFGCNMLAHADGVIGNIARSDPAQLWQSATARALRSSCRAGENPGCRHCDAGSRSMNHVLRTLAAETVRPPQAPHRRPLTEAPGHFVKETR